MKRIVFVLMAALTVAFVLPSCSKSTYPRDPYRGASGYPGAYRSKPAKEKSYRRERTVPVKYRN